MKKKNKLFTFRRYKKKESGKRHPKLIVSDTGSNFGFMGLTESERKGHHRNIPLSRNPKKNDKRPAYLRKEIRFDNKDNFSEILDNYNLSVKDKKYIIEFVKTHKKR